jgi:hypothetical protein
MGERSGRRRDWGGTGGGGPEFVLRRVLGQTLRTNERLN